MPTEPFYTLSETARVLGLSRATVYNRLYAGDLTAVKLGRKTMIPGDSIRRFLASLPDWKAAKTPCFGQAA